MLNEITAGLWKGFRKGFTIFRIVGGDANFVHVHVYVLSRSFVVMEEASTVQHLRIIVIAVYFFILQYSINWIVAGFKTTDKIKDLLSSGLF